MLQLQSFDDCKQLSGSVIAMNPSRNGNKGAIYSYNLDSYKELTRQACLLRYICNSKAAWIKEVILTFGEKWEKAIEDFIEWSVKYDLWCKMRFFGMKMEEAIDSDRRLVNHSGPSNLLAFVPDTFSLMDIQTVYQMQGKKGRLTALLAMWAKRGHYGTPMAA